MNGIIESKDCTVSYVTDIEGNLDYWERFVTMSQILERDPETREISMKVNCHLVFGGDVCDRGPGDIRVVRELLDLKYCYPDQVHFILGNRDVNKLRLATELQMESVAEPGKVYWVDASSEPAGALPEALMSPIQESVGSQTQADRLKWILKSTMGSPAAFDYRKQELAALDEPYEDCDVVSSYLQWISAPHGELFQFMKFGKIAVIIGDTLYVHGALRPSNIGWVPPRRGEQSCGKQVHDLRVWVHEMNEFLAAELEDFEANMDSYIQQAITGPSAAEHKRNGFRPWEQIGGYGHPMPASRLLQYGIGFLPNHQENPSATYSCYLFKASPQFTAQQVIRESVQAMKDFHKFAKRRPTASGRSLARGLSREVSVATAGQALQERSHTNHFTNAVKMLRASNVLRSKSSAEGEGKPHMGLRNAIQAVVRAASADTAGSLPIPPSRPEKESGVLSIRRLSSHNGASEIPEVTVSLDGDDTEESASPLRGVKWSSTDSDDIAPSMPPPALPQSSSLTSTVKPNSGNPSAPSFPRLSMLSMRESINMSMHIPGSGQSGSPSNHDLHVDHTEETPREPMGGIFAPPEQTAAAEEAAERSLNAFIRKSGILRIVVGHQPRGDAPLVLSMDGIQVISADSSYAVNVVWEGNYEAPAIDTEVSEDNQFSVLLDALPDPPRDSTRGIAVAELLIKSGEEGSRAFMFGRLSNRLDYQFELQPPDAPNNYVGKQTASGWYVKLFGIIARIRDESRGDSPAATISPKGQSGGHFFGASAPIPGVDFDSSEASDELGPLGANIKDDFRLCYLLSKTAGFSVKNRLVYADNIDVELLA